MSENLPNEKNKFLYHSQKVCYIILITVSPSCPISITPCPGPRLNIKTVLSTYGDFHVKDKTAVRTSYL